MICRFVFSGAGGQGIITSAIILAETAVYFDKLNAVQTQSYGPEARGGAARADVIVASDQINFPKVMQPNILVCLSQESYDKYNGVVRPGGMILLDSSLVRRKKNVAARQIEFPMNETVLGEFGTTMPLNICMLGCMARLIDFITTDSLAEMVNQRFSGKAADMNRKALDLGYALASKLFTEPPLQFH
mgnify:CR=1 FL=1